LRSYSALGVGETITIKYNQKYYALTILEVKPENTYKAVSIIETDVQVDFAPPMDHEEPPEKKENLIPTKPKTQEKDVLAKSPTEEGRFRAFSGGGKTISGKPLSPGTSPVQKKSAFEDSGSEDEEEGDKKTFVPFSGSGHTLKKRN